MGRDHPADRRRTGAAGHHPWGAGTHGPGRRTADKAGLRPGDVLTRLGDDELESPEDLLAALRSKSPGQTVTVEFRRGTSQQGGYGGRISRARPLASG
ncbi:PDZ domain-containing protein [Arthrobacter sp. OAP107]|uniref:PDZ domain-containing protein n=1 Tax=Arthrobacter sp. OAP107 TaxID=3156445 RepID=UPI0033940D96